MTDKKTLAALGIDQEGIDKLEAEHKKVHILIGEEYDEEIPWAVILRKPTAKEWKRYKLQANDSSQSVNATENLFKQIVVHPSADAVNALLEEWPAIPEASSDLVARLIGAKAKEAGK